MAIVCCAVYEWVLFQWVITEREREREGESESWLNSLLCCVMRTTFGRLKYALRGRELCSCAHSHTHMHTTTWGGTYGIQWNPGLMLQQRRFPSFLNGSSWFYLTLNKGLKIENCVAMVLPCSLWLFIMLHRKVRVIGLSWQSIKYCTVVNGSVSTL